MEMLWIRLLRCGDADATVRKRHTGTTEHAAHQHQDELAQIRDALACPVEDGGEMDAMRRAYREDCAPGREH